MRLRMIGPTRFFWYVAILGIAMISWVSIRAAGCTWPFWAVSAASLAIGWALGAMQWWCMRSPGEPFWAPPWSDEGEDFL